MLRTAKKSGLVSQVRSEELKDINSKYGLTLRRPAMAAEMFPVSGLFDAAVGLFGTTFGFSAVELPPLIRLAGS
jgi:hypothetical protein